MQDVKGNCVLKWYWIRPMFKRLSLYFAVFQSQFHRSAATLSFVFSPLWLFVQSLTLACQCVEVKAAISFINKRTVTQPELPQQPPNRVLPKKKKQQPVTSQMKHLCLKCSKYWIINQMDSEQKIYCIGIHLYFQE